jgi:DNA-binding GntR family transcriptional regulator
VQPTTATKSGRVYETIRHDIVTGRLTAGTVLDEAALATAYEVSRTPVREAMRSLAMDGLLVAGARRQMMVVDVSARHRDEITLLRTALEGAAATVACQVVTPDDLDQLQLIIIKQRRHAEAGDSEEFLELDEQFHKALAEVARLPTLSRFLDQLGAFVRLTRIGVSTPRAHMLALVAEHTHLLELLADRRGEELRVALTEHIQTTTARG